MKTVNPFKPLANMFASKASAPTRQTLTAGAGPLTCHTMRDIGLSQADLMRK